MKDENERVEALNAIFDDDPFEKEREKERQKEILKLEKKHKKQLAKQEKNKKKHVEEDVPENVPEENREGEAQEEGMTDSDVQINASGEKTLQEDAETKKKKKKRKKRKEKEKEEINIVKDLISLAVYILTIVVVCWLILTFVGQRTEVSGDSMNDTLHDGDSLWIDKLSYRFSDPERFDIVVFPYEDDTYYIKRIIGLPGETVHIDEDGVIYINDEPLKEDYGKEVIAKEYRGLAAETVTLSDDEYFVMGDNRNNSRDSRLADVGNIKRDTFVGKAVFRFSGGFGFLNQEE